MSGTTAGPASFAELDPSDTLASRPFELAADRGGPTVPLPGASVRCGRPLSYPIPAADLPPYLRGRARTRGSRYYGLLFAFDLDLPIGVGHYTAARFEVTLEPASTIAVEVHEDGGALGVAYVDGAGRAASPSAVHTVDASASRSGWLDRLIPRADSPRPWVYGVQSAQFGWCYEDRDGRATMPRSCGMHAVVEVASTATEIRGSVDVSVAVGSGGTRARRREARTTYAVPFVEPLSPGEVPSSAAAVRLCMAADIAGYSRRVNAVTERFQHRLVEVLGAARGAAGIDEHDVHLQPQGDGQFAVLPVGLDESTVIPRLVCGLGRALHEDNRDAPADERMRLRLALHRGLVKPADSGWVGVAAIAVHRILDSEPVRAGLRDEPTSDLVLGVPDVLYRDVIEHATEPPGPERFTAITVALPEKGFLEPGWRYIYMPEGTR